MKITTRSQKKVLQVLRTRGSTCLWTLPRVLLLCTTLVRVLFVATPLYCLWPLPRLLFVCTTVLSLFYHRSGIIFVALVAKPRVATQYRFNEKPHTIADDMVSHHVITLFFVLLATRSIQKTVASVGWYILPPKWQKLW